MTLRKTIMYTAAKLRLLRAPLQVCSACSGDTVTAAL